MRGVAMPCGASEGEGSRRQRRKTAAERRAQRLRAEGRAAIRWLGAFLEIQRHRGGELPHRVEGLVGLLARFGAPRPGGGGSGDGLQADAGVAVAETDGGKTVVDEDYSAGHGLTGAVVSAEAVVQGSEALAALEGTVLAMEDVGVEPTGGEQQVEAVVPAAGSRVRLRGLVARRELNGRRGVVCGDRLESGRFVVVLDEVRGGGRLAEVAKEKEQVRILGANLELLGTLFPGLLDPSAGGAQVPDPMAGWRAQAVG